MHARTTIGAARLDIRDFNVYTAVDEKRIGGKRMVHRQPSDKCSQRVSKYPRRVPVSPAAEGGIPSVSGVMNGIEPTVQISPAWGAVIGGFKI